MDQTLDKRNVIPIMQYHLANNNTYVAEQNSVSDSKNLLEKWVSS